MKLSLFSVALLLLAAGSEAKSGRHFRKSRRQACPNKAAVEQGGGTGAIGSGISTGPSKQGVASESTGSTEQDDSTSINSM